MAKKSISKIGDKLVKVAESFTVSMYDNGFMFEISGRDKSGDYKTVKIMVSEFAQLAALLQEATEMERDE
jgi:hypothetical protein